MDTTMPHEVKIPPSLLTLLDQWQEAQDAGMPKSPADLCNGDVRLQAALEEALRKKQRGDLVREAKPLTGFPSLPGYVLHQVVGQGGMGVIVRAMELKFRRPVAVKLLSAAGAVGGAAAQRFLNEAHITAQLQHPGIPAVYDLGTTPAGLPFLAMKLIEGESLQDLLDSGKPIDIPAVFESVCQAVGYAHAHGVIHRDLKPSNIMVGAFGEVQVMDWGVAKSTGSLRGAALAGDFAPAAAIEATERSTVPDPAGNAWTKPGSALGTYAYMPPEQALGRVEEVGPSSDVFGLGATLCHLLTGQPPYADTETPLETQAKEAMLAPAFARLDACSDQDLADLAKRCLNPVESQRFPDGAVLADEMALHRLNAEKRLKQTELAHNRSEARQKVLMWSSGAIAAVLLLGTIGTTVGLLRAKDEAAAKEAARDAEATAKANAEKRLTNVEKANAIMASIFENLDPKEIARAERPLQAILVEKIDKAIEMLDGEAIGDELVVAKMQNKMGLSLLGLGKPEKAIIIFERCRNIQTAKLGTDHPDTLTSINNLARAYRSAGRLTEALPLFEETLKLRIANIGYDHPDTLVSVNNLAYIYEFAGRLTEALPLYEETLKLEKAKFGSDHATTLISMNNLARAYQSAGRLEEALPLYEETLKLRKKKLSPNHPDILVSMNNLANGYKSVGRLKEALPLHEETLKLSKAKLGPDHPDTLNSMNNLACAYQSAGRLTDALPLHEETLKLSKAKLGPGHPDTLSSMHNLARAYQSAGRLEEALPLFEETLKLRKDKLGPGHPDTLSSMNKLAYYYKSVGRLKEALPLYEETLMLRKANLGPDHPDTLTSMNNLAIAYKSVGRLTEALLLYEETLKLCKAKLGPDHPDTLICESSFARLLHELGRSTEAIPMFDNVLTVVERMNYQHEYAGAFHHYAWTCYEATDEWTRAESTRRKWAAQLKTKSGRESSAYARKLVELGVNLLAQKKWAEAEATLRECLAIRRKITAEVWSTFNTESLLGEAIAGQKKTGEALELLLSGYHGLKKRETQIPPGTNRLREAVQRLIDYYSATQQSAKAMEWQAKLPKEYAPLPRKEIDVIVMTFEEVMAGIEKRVRERETAEAVPK